MNSNNSPGNLMEPDDSAEWEYEYDENETEDYYFTLDVTKHETAQPMKAPKSNSKGQQGIPNEQTNSIGSTTAKKNPSTAGPATKPGRGGTSQASGIPNSKLQFLDLHSEIPLLKLDDRLYSCHWSTDLGTQVHVARSGTTRKPLRSGRVLDVVGVTRARLVARPAKVRLRKGYVAETNVASAGNATSIGEDGEGDVVAGASGDILMNGTEQSPKPRDTGEGPRFNANVSFRQQLNAIKLKKGLNDSGPSGGARSSDAP